MYKNPKNVVKITITLLNVIVFSYMIIYAERFKADERKIVVNANFIEGNITQSNSININDVVINNEGGGTITYIVQKGDNLESIAQKFGSTVKNIKKINNLKRDTLKIGQKLTIAEEDGIIFTIKSDTNLILFANQYNLDIEDLKTLNYITDNNQKISAGEEIFVPLSEQEAIDKGLIVLPDTPPTPSKPIVVNKPKPAATQTNNVRVVTATKNIIEKQTVVNESEASQEQEDTPNSTINKSSIKAERYYSANISNSFYRGFCTRYAAIKRPDIFKFVSENRQERPFGGNAREWYGNAERAGFAVGKKPAPGALIIFHRGGPGYSSAGHVGIVLEVNNETNELLIEDMNYKAKFVVTQRYISQTDSNIIGYIY